MKGGASQRAPCQNATSPESGPASSRRKRGVGRGAHSATDAGFGARRGPAPFVGYGIEQRRIRAPIRSYHDIWFRSIHRRTPTSFPHTLTSFPHTPTSFPHILPSFPHILTSFPHILTSFPHILTSFPLPPTSFPRRRESPPPCIAFDKTELTYYHRTMTTPRNHKPKEIPPCANHTNPQPPSRPSA